MDSKMMAGLAFLGLGIWYATKGGGASGTGSSGMTPQQYAYYQQQQQQLAAQQQAAQQNNGNGWTALANNAGNIIDAGANLAEVILTNKNNDKEEEGSVSDWLDDEFGELFEV